ncbi:hypothetical protein [Zavarzinella formosa]|uniref:hypothetical protein n=1 Tax=Zavarzinella formosa TaxID=360055 RepID=UPI0012FCC1F8|nr:hypothetical protein [Zavarzinella formosa]
MAIEGSKTVGPRRADPAPSGFAVNVIWFTPVRAGGPYHPVTSVAGLLAVLEPYRDHERLAVFLNRDGGDNGAVWVHLTGDRAWVTHFTEMGGIDSYCRDAGYGGPDEMVGFLLDNGQLDDIHRYWTVTRAGGLQALKYFLLHGERDPGLSWVEQPQSLQDAEPGDATDRRPPSQ